MVLQHHWFVGCEIETVCFKKVLPGVVEVFARKKRNEESDTVDERMSRLKQGSWCLELVVLPLDGRDHYGMPRLVVSLEAINAHITHVISKEFRNSPFHEMGTAFP